MKIDDWCRRCAFNDPKDLAICVDCLMKTIIECGIDPKPHCYESRTRATWKCWNCGHVNSIIDPHCTDCDVLRTPEIMYHIYTDNQDEYTPDYRLAKAIFRAFVRKNESARLYELKHWEEEDTEEENCLFSEGDFPS